MAAAEYEKVITTNAINTNSKEIYNAL